MALLERLGGGKLIAALTSPRRDLIDPSGFMIPTGLPPAMDHALCLMVERVTAHDCAGCLKRIFNGSFPVSKTTDLPGAATPQSPGGSRAVGGARPSSKRKRVAFGPTTYLAQSVVQQQHHHLHQRPAMQPQQQPIMQQRRQQHRQWQRHHSQQQRHQQPGRREEAVRTIYERPLASALAIDALGVRGDFVAPSEALSVGGGSSSHGDGMIGVRAQVGSRSSTAVGVMRSAGAVGRSLGRAGGAISAAPSGDGSSFDAASEVSTRAAAVCRVATTRSAPVHSTTRVVRVGVRAGRRSA